MRNAHSQKLQCTEQNEMLHKQVISCQRILTVFEPEKMTKAKFLQRKNKICLEILQKPDLKFQTTQPISAKFKMIYTNFYEDLWTQVTHCLYTMIVFELENLLILNARETKNHLQILHKHLQIL